MNRFTRAFRELTRRETPAAAAESMPPGIIPPSRRATSDTPVSLVPVYRAIDIISSAVAQIPLRVERGGVEVPSSEINPLIKRPSLTLTRPDFLEQITISLAVSGNAFLLAKRANGQILELIVLNPHEVHVAIDSRNQRIRYDYRGKTYTNADIQHLRLMTLPGQIMGLGPLQAAKRELTGATLMRDFAAAWFDNTGQPSGILTSDQALTREDAQEIRNTWNNLDREGNALSQTANPSGIKVLGKGATYRPILLSPHDAQYIEARQFSTREITRLFGIPSTLMLIGTEGNSMTYQNVEEDWINFVRFTLTKYLRKIEEALTQFTPRGQTVRFQINALLRADTLKRYKAHKIAMEAGFMTINEIREIESLPPMKEAPHENQ